MIKLIEGGNEVEIEVVRYFTHEGSKYLIYTKNEVDEQNYVKLYATKAEDASNIVAVEDAAEWKTLADEVKNIIRANKDGVADISDLDDAELEGATINGQKPFKLGVQMKDLLSANKKEFTKEVEEAPEEESAFDAFSVDENTEEDTDFSVPFNSFEEETEEEEENNVGFDAFDNVSSAFDEEVEETPEEDQEEESAFDAFEPEETPEMENPFEPSVVGEEEETEEPDYSVEEDKDYPSLYEEEKALNEVLKSEIEELREKLNRITKIITE